MKGLAAAIGIRRRHLDGLRLALGERQRQLTHLAATQGEERDQRSKERRLAIEAPLSADAWFQASAERLAALAGEEQRVQIDLASLRRIACDARARLTLLEEAQAAARQSERRRREARTQAALDDRTAANWTRP